MANQNSTTGSDSFRPPSKYLGQDYRFTPTYLRPRDPISPPTSPDIKPKEQQGHYPVTSLWTNQGNHNLWALVGIVNNLGIWVLLSSGGVGPLLSITGDDGVKVVPDVNGNVNLQGLVVPNSTHPKAVFTESPGPNLEKIDVQVAAAIPATNITKVGLAAFSSAQFTVDANGFVQLAGGGTAPIETLSDNVNTKVSPDGTGNIQLKGQLNEQAGGSFATTISVPGSNLIKTNPMSSSRWIVDPLSSVANPNGTHTTIGVALTAATAGDTIFIMPGIYTENLILKAGVNICSFECDALTPNVTIVGKATYTDNGTVSLSGIRLQTNGDFFLSVTGSNASNVYLTNCYFNCTNNTGINFTTSNVNASILCYNCKGNLATVGIAYFNSSSIGSLQLFYCRLLNSGGSLTSNTISAGTVGGQFNQLTNPLTASGTVSFSFIDSLLDTTNINATPITTSSTSLINNIKNSVIRSGTASCISTSQAFSVTNTELTSTNVNVITGTGTINYAGLVFSGSNIINTTTQTCFNSGTFLPALKFGGNSVGMTYSNQYGKYYRLDNMCIFNIYIVLTNKGTSTGNATIMNLPFVSANDGATYAFVTEIENGGGAALQILYGNLVSNAGGFGLISSVAGAGALINDVNFNNNTLLRISGSYFI